MNTHLIKKIVYRLSFFFVSCTLFATEPIGASGNIPVATTTTTAPYYHLTLSHVYGKMALETENQVTVDRESWAFKLGLEQAVWIQEHHRISTYWQLGLGKAEFDYNDKAGILTLDSKILFDLHFNYRNSSNPLLAKLAFHFNLYEGNEFEDQLNGRSNLPNDISIKDRGLELGLGYRFSHHFSPNYQHWDLSGLILLQESRYEMSTGWFQNTPETMDNQDRLGAELNLAWTPLQKKTF